LAVPSVRLRTVTRRIRAGGVARLKGSRSI
jgi:hypothetical protein